MVYSRPAMPVPGTYSSNVPPIPPRGVFGDNPPSYEEVVGEEGGVPPPIPPRNFLEPSAPPLPSRPVSLTPSLPPRPSRPARTADFNPTPETPIGFIRSEGPPPIPARPQLHPSDFSRSHNLPSESLRPNDPLSSCIPSEEPPTAAITSAAAAYRPAAKLPVAIENVTTRMSELSVDRALNLDNVLKPVPPADVFAKITHEVPIPGGTDNGGKPIETNKFYGNMLIGSQTNPIWTHPYSLWLSKEAPFLGVAVAHCTANQRVFGPDYGPKQFMFNPIGIKSFVFSSPEFANQEDMTLGLTDLKHMSGQILLKKNDNQLVHIPLVQGMGFVTAIYLNLVPKLQSAVAFKDFRQVQSSFNGQKYAIMLENGITWSLYVSGAPVQLNLIDPTTIMGSQRVSRTVFQLVADFKDEIDTAAGCFPEDCQLACSTHEKTGQYSFIYAVSGSSISGSTLMYALPHHQSSFINSMAPRRISSRLDSTVCGVMTGYVTNCFEMKVEIPDQLQFEPFTTIPGAPSKPNYSPEVLSIISRTASREVNCDVVNESNLDSMYFSGKILAKYAWILYCCYSILEDESLISTLMPKLKEAMARFVSNNQMLPLRYDTSWGGIVSSGTNSEDFGNSYYNDHHFHYSYHVITAAILAIVDREAGGNTWLTENRQWVETLIRDYANPSEKDPYFPVFRSFDWFNGHSWAKGLFESGDGKDQESSSEDVNASYSLKLWGLATQNFELMNLADIQLGVLKTSLNLYFLYTDDNETMPPEIVANKVSGIKFENKIDHTTYFGNQLQYIQMIHAIPITPASSFIRSARFVKEEWEEKLKAIIDDIDDGWKGIIMLNLALFDPNLSYAFFSAANFNPQWLDGGQSWTWSLAYSGAFLE